MAVVCALAAPASARRAIARARKADEERCVLIGVPLLAELEAELSGGS